MKSTVYLIGVALVGIFIMLRMVGTRGMNTHPSNALTFESLTGEHETPEPQRACAQLQHMVDTIRSNRLPSLDSTKRLALPLGPSRLTKKVAANIGEELLDEEVQDDPSSDRSRGNLCTERLSTLQKLILRDYNPDHTLSAFSD